MKSYCHIYAQFDQVGEGIGDELRHLFDLGLVCDTSFHLRQGRGKRDTLQELRLRGGLTAPSIYPSDCDPACKNPNWWTYSKEECLRLLRMARTTYESLDLGPMEAINTYTPGNGFVAACRELGIRYIFGFCAPIIIEDGDWNIAHYGSPLSPYFVGEEDFRKPEDPGLRSDSVLMSSMELRNPLICLRHWSQGAWTPISTLCADRSLEPGDEPLPFIAAAEDWLRQTEMTGEPRFFHVNLEYFFCGKCSVFNRKALEWLVGQRDLGRLGIGSIQPWAKRMQTAGGFLKQTTYWRGEMMGFHVGHRPGSVADVIVSEELDGQVVWEYPDALPKRWYDYTDHWNFPAYEPDGSAPASKARPAMAVEILPLADTPTERLFRISLANPGSPEPVRLALWDMLWDCAGPFRVECPREWDTEAVPHPAGSGGAILLSGACPPGKTTVDLRVKFTGRSSDERNKKSWGSLIEVQTFSVRGESCTILASQTPERFSVIARVAWKASDKPVRVESLCGVDYQERTMTADGLPLHFDGTRLACWHRFWGVNADELEIQGVDEVEARLKSETLELMSGFSPAQALPEPGYQLFGPIRDKSRWDRSLGRAAGEAELKRIGELFRSRCPESGEILIEAHPGIYLPRGSISKALGSEFDQIICQEGFAFRGQCVDYPQAWDWGVSAWVQWRYLKLEIQGLKGRNGRFTLYFHAFDPEGRDISQRIHFFDPGQRRVEYCVVKDWPLPRGLEGRWDKASLRSVEIPVECLEWETLGIWISPLDKIKLYDWIDEKGAPGMISHLWLARSQDQVSGPL